MKPVTNEKAAGDATEEASNVDYVNVNARSPEDSSRGLKGGEGMAFQLGQTVNPKAEAEGMGRTTLSTPAPLRARKLPGPDPEHIGATPGSSHCAKSHWNVPPNAVCGACRLMEPLPVSTPGWDGFCAAARIGVCTGDVCKAVNRHNGILAFQPLSHQLDGLVGRARSNMRPDIMDPDPVQEREELRRMFRNHDQARESAAVGRD
jgi:hypothetical protein